jgi:flagellar assembly factor FliW
VEVETTRFGHVEIDESFIITIPEGLLGFEDLKRFIILDHFDKESPFKWRQSIEDPSLAFIITDSLIFVPDYKAKIHKDEMINIELSDTSKAIIVVIVNIKWDYSEITTNLQGPLGINPEKKLAKQCIWRNDDYDVRHLIFSQSTNQSTHPKNSERTKEAKSQSL